MNGEEWRSPDVDYQNQSAITKHRLTRMFRSKSKGQPESYPFTFQYCLKPIVLTMRAGAARMARARAAMCR
jgi:hypothetical protein